MDKPKYFSKLIGRASVLQDVPETKVLAAKKRYEASLSLEERGKFPTGIVTQPDVLALQSVILTTGRPGNLNDDVMLNEEVLPILWTAALKPFNLEHSKFIIGTMFDSFAINKETGEVVPAIEKYIEQLDDEESEEEEREIEIYINFSKLPENLDIITNQVLWALHFPQEVAAVKRKAIAGELFVSMEVWFTDYDYLVGNRVVKRTPELAEILDSKLRINGGSGFLGIDKVKRVPRNLTFAGNAAVETPANPESFILDVMDRGDLMDSKELEREDSECDEHKVESNLDERIKQLVAENTLCTLESLSDEGEASENQNDVWEAGRSGDSMGSDVSEAHLASAEVGEVVTHSEEKNMPFDEKTFVEYVESNAVLQAKLDESDESLATANKDKEELQARNDELEAKLEETLALVQEKETELAAKAEAFEELEAEKTELNTKLEETSAALAEIEEARKLDNRKAALAEIGLSNERIVKILAKTDELDDDAFNAEVEDLKAFMEELTPAETEAEETPEVEETEGEKKEDMKDEKKKKDEAKKKAECSEDESEVVSEPEVEAVEASEEEIAEVLEEAEEEPVEVAEAVGAASTEDEANDDVEQIQSAMAKALGIHLD